ncbi:MAG: double zinc ribbon domain-containing protein [Paracoccaceae bacterium]
MLYPPQCIMCREQLQSENALCGSCWRDMPFTRIARVFVAVHR